jgi:hypothetical protein
LAKDGLWSVQIYKIEKSDPINKESSIFEEENLKLLFKDSIGYFQGLIEFIRDLIIRKINS